jgi:anthraniloyl-CoA monooxygenase
MKVNIIGGGPAGLYLAILLKQRDPRHAIAVYERDRPDDTFGWGIVFAGRTLSLLAEYDPPSHAAVLDGLETWDNVDVVHCGERVSVGGNNFSGIARLRFLNILQQRCAELGVQLEFSRVVEEGVGVEALRDCDLLVGADGANSTVRRTYAPFFQPIIDLRQNRYVWLGTRRRFDGLTMIFRQSEAGLFIGHAYRFGPATSTFVVECPPDTWLRAGLDRLDEPAACAYLAEVFRGDLGGEPLLSNNFLRWQNFPLIKNKRWRHENVVLLGDALHTAHFSIGSGTRLALEDAMVLADAFRERPGVEDALARFEALRRPRVEEFQEAALTSLVWLENVAEQLHLPPVPFAYRLMTRSRRTGYNRLSRKDPGFIARFDEWRATQPKEGAIPRDFLDLFRKRSFAHLATLMPDGTPQVTPVWIDYDGEYLIINSARGRRKDRNMEERPEVAVEIQDPDNPNRYLAVRGPVVAITEEGADEHLDRLAQRYLSREFYPPTWRFPGEVRRLYKIRPEHVLAWEPFG